MLFNTAAAKNRMSTHALEWTMFNRQLGYSRPFPNFSDMFDPREVNFSEECLIPQEYFSADRLAGSLMMSDQFASDDRSGSSLEKVVHSVELLLGKRIGFKGVDLRELQSVRDFSRSYAGFFPLPADSFSQYQYRLDSLDELVTMLDFTPSLEEMLLLQGWLHHSGKPVINFPHGILCGNTFNPDTGEVPILWCVHDTIDVVMQLPHEPIPLNVVNIPVLFDSRSGSQALRQQYLEKVGGDLVAA